MDPYEQNTNVDLGFIDFTDEQLMELIRTEAEEPAAHQFCAIWDCDHGLDCLAPPTAAQFVPTPDDLKLSSLYDFDSFPESRNEILVIEEEKKVRKKTDRLRTIISERKRRSSMKDKLYALRSLVPYITKMDKASIIGDAIRYLQDLQKKIDDLKVEIDGIESSLKKPVELSFLRDNCIMDIVPPPIKQILQMEVFQVELREFYVRIMCIKSEGIAALLYMSLDSIGLDVQSSNLATTDDLNYLFTFTLNANEVGTEIKLENLKLWIAAALCDQGFHFVTLPSTD